MESSAAGMHDRPRRRIRWHEVIVMLFEAVSLFFLIFTSLVGVTALLKLLFESLFGSEPDRLLHVFPISGEEPGVEYVLRGLLARTGGPIAVLDCGMNEEKRDIVRALIRRYGERLVLLGPDELGHWAAEYHARIVPQGSDKAPRGREKEAGHGAAGMDHH